MATVLILGGGFAAVTAAQELASRLSETDEIILVSKSSAFTFYPAIIPCIFGDLKFDDIQFDLARILNGHGIRFIHGYVESIDTTTRTVGISNERTTHSINYDYLLFAIGRRLEPEAIPGLEQYSHQLFTVERAEEFKKAISDFKTGSIVVGLCPGSLLPVPICESALALADVFAAQIKSGKVLVKVVFPATLEQAFAGANLFRNIEDGFRRKGVELITGFEVEAIESERIISRDGRALDHDLLMMIPPFGGQLSLQSAGHITNIKEFTDVNEMMQVAGLDHVYAAGDMTSLPGPKFGYMAIRQGKVAAENIASQIVGDTPVACYQHRIEWAIGALYTGPVFFHYGFWDETLDDFDDDAMFGMARKIRHLYGSIKGLETAGLRSPV